MDKKNMKITKENAVFCNILYDHKNIPLRDNYTLKNKGLKNLKGIFMGKAKRNRSPITIYY